MKVRSFASGISRLRRRITPCGFAFILLLPALRGQPAARVADEDWKNLQVLLSPGRTADKGARPTPAQREADRLQHADRLQRAAAQAKEFYSRNPSDAKAAQARKIEVTASLESARLGRPSQDASALALAAAFRADKSQWREDRFEVALAAERLSLLRRAGAKASHERPQDYEKMADDLRREFGPIPEVQGLYAGLATSVDMVSANRLATKLLEMRPTPAGRAAAENITARYGMLGHPLSLRLNGLDAGAFELPATVVGEKPTILYVWSPDPAPGSDPFAPLAALKNRLPNDAGWIYLGLGATTAQASAAQKKAPLAGTHCRDDAGPTSPTAQRLKVRSFPMVFVLNRRGELSGFGRVDELPALFNAARR